MRFKMYSVWIFYLKIYAAMECQELNIWEPKARESGVMRLDSWLLL